MLLLHGELLPGATCVPHPLPICSAPRRPSQQLDSDAYLQGINTLLHNAQTASLLTAGQPGQAAGGRASGGGADSGLLIPPELQRWVFDWSELSIRHLLGRGSYGRVRCLLARCST